MDYQTCSQCNCAGEAACPPNSHYNAETKECACVGSDLWEGTACCPIFQTYDAKAGKCVCINDYSFNGKDCAYKTPNGESDPPLNHHHSLIS